MVTERVTQCLRKDKEGGDIVAKQESLIQTLDGSAKSVTKADDMKGKDKDDR